MSKGLFATDLDRTLIFSKRMLLTHPSKLPMQLVERIEGKDTSYIPLGAVRDITSIEKLGIQVVPTTSRSIPEYNRIDFGVDWKPKYAITSGGGHILVNGENLRDWENEINRKFISSQANLIRETIKVKIKSTSYTPKIIDDSYVFVKLSDNPILFQQSLEELEQLRSSMEGIRICIQGHKVYVSPESISKERAVKYLATFLGANKIYAAGDSDVDIPMLKSADVSFSPTHGDIIRGRKFKPSYTTPSSLDGAKWMIRLMLEIAYTNQQ